jgi:outer membrane lipoprotein carrier protein
MTHLLLLKIARSALFASVLLAAFGTAQPSPARTALDTVQAIEKHYQALTTLTAAVSQKNFLRSLEKTQTFEGTIWIKKPDSLRLEYTNGQLILVDGKRVLLYSRKSEQLIKKTFTDFAQMNLPVAFLLGAGHITDDFDIASPDPKAPERVELVPKKPGAAMKKLSLAANAEGRISELRIYDKSGNVTEIVFSAIHEGADFDRKLFSFKLPKGTEIIEQ